MRLLLVLLAIGFASPAIAAPAPVSDVATCLAAADDFATRRACVGQVSAACQDEGDGGVTTAGMVRCADRERAQWEAIRDAALVTLRARESATQSAARERALSAHTAWLDARCAYDASLYEGGSMAIYAAAACEMGRTADIALILHSRARDLLPD